MGRIEGDRGRQRDGEKNSEIKEKKQHGADGYTQRKGRFILMKSRTPLVSLCVSLCVCARMCVCDKSVLGQFDGCWNS